MVCEIMPSMTAATFEDLRASGRGPAYLKPTGPRGQITLYAKADVIAWVKRSRVSTRDLPISCPHSIAS
jgi:hypothetical protein